MHVSPRGWFIDGKIRPGETECIGVARVRLLVFASRDRGNPGFAGGDLTMTEVSEHLVARGHQVTYVCSKFPNCEPVDNIEGVDIVRVGSLWTTSFRAFLFYVKNRHRFETVLQEALGGLRTPYFAPLYSKKPFVAVWYQRNEKIFRYQYNRFVAALLGMLERVLGKIHQDILVLCPSKQSQRELQQLGLHESLTRVYTPGMDERVLARSSEAFRSERQNKIAWIGKIRRFKCPHHAIMVLDRVRKTVPGCTLVIAGYPEDRTYLNYMKDVASRLGVSDALSFRPRISEEEKGTLLLKSKALLVTSPIEGFANVASEANACGTPVVATNGIPSDVVTNNVNGFRVAFGDVNAMAIACETLLQDRETFERMSKQGVELASQRSWTETTSTFLSALEEVSHKTQI